MGCITPHNLMANMWLTSDTHFSHYNIIRYCDRPFASAEEMDEALVAYWNDTVRPEDSVYHLGDVTIIRGNRVQQEKMAHIIRRLNGHKRLILGNHDHFSVQAYIEAGFEKVRGTGRWLNGFLLSHFPVHPDCMGTAKGCIHGHIHDRVPPAPVVRFKDNGSRVEHPYINVCVEVRNYRPVNFDEAIA